MAGQRLTLRGSRIVPSKPHVCTIACGIYFDPDCPSVLWPHVAEREEQVREAVEAAARDVAHRARKTADLLRHPAMRSAFATGLRDDIAGVCREVMAADLPEALAVLGLLTRRNRR